MSDPVAKAERSKAKDARQTPAPDKVPRSKSKKDKPWRVESRGGWLRSTGWIRHGDYRTREIAEKVISDEQRKWAQIRNFDFEYRIIPPEQRSNKKGPTSD